MTETESVNYVDALITMYMANNNINNHTLNLSLKCVRRFCNIITSSAVNYDPVLNLHKSDTVCEQKVCRSH